MDLLLLSELNQKDLENLCKVNKYFRDICKEYQNKKLDKQEKLEILELPISILKEVLPWGNNIIVKNKNLGKFHKLTGYSGNTSALIFPNSNTSSYIQIFIEDEEDALDDLFGRIVFYPVANLSNGFVYIPLDIIQTTLNHGIRFYQSLAEYLYKKWKKEDILFEFKLPLREENTETYKILRVPIKKGKMIPTTKTTSYKMITGEILNVDVVHKLQ